MNKDDDGLGGIAKIARGLTDLVNLLGDLSKGGDLPHQGRHEKQGIVVEYSNGRKTADGSPVEPSAESDRDRRGKPGRRSADGAAKRTEIEVLEPATDVFDEPTETLLLFDIPGVSLPDVRCVLEGDILTLKAKADGRRYRKEVLIEAKLTGEPPALRLDNGILEVRLQKQA
jgi:HSP20 family molecular chaperone IbpA